MNARLVIASLAALAVVATTTEVAVASEQHPTLHELETELMCPTCKTTLEASEAPVAERMRTFIRTRISAGDTKGEIKGALVDQFGEAVLAAPPTHGFNLLAWLGPLAGLGAATAAVTTLLWKWRRAEAEPTGPDDAAFDHALDEELEKALARLDV
jgi:cytochrome c-type biogenesis protein CcmH